MELLTKNLMQFVNEIFDSIVEDVVKIIEIPTVNPPGINYVECSKLIASIMKKVGFKVKLFEVSRNMHNYEGDTRVNVVGEYAFGNGKVGLHFHTHYDVVPTGSGWSLDPFRPIIRDDKLYGRGSCDMKSALIASLYIPLIVKNVADKLGLELNGRVTVSATPDEETGGALGAGYIVDNNLIVSDYTVMPEPTALKYVWYAHKGCIWLKVTIVGRQIHATLSHRGINAFEKVCLLVNELLKLREKVESRVSCYPAYPEDGNRANMVIGGLSKSGDSVNTVPGVAWFTIDRRILPEEDVNNARAEILNVIEGFKARNKDVRVRVEETLAIKPASIDVNHELIKFIDHAVKEVTGFAVKPVLCPGFLNIRYFIGRGQPAVAWGPGELDYAHAPDENIKLDDLKTWTIASSLILIRLLERKNLQ